MGEKKTNRVASERERLEKHLENINALMKTETGRTRMVLAEKKKSYARDS